MDPISAGASVIAFVSLAIQLAESTTQLYHFWGSIKDAPNSIKALTDDLRLVSTVLEEIQSDAKHCNPDETCLKALQNSQALVARLNALAEDLAPGFASTKRHLRTFTALKALGRNEKIQKCRASLSDMKSTLTLIQQRLLSSLVRGNHTANEIHQHKIEQGLAAVNVTLGALQVKHQSFMVPTPLSPSFNAGRHEAALRAEIDRISSKLSPVYASICKRAIVGAFDEILPEHLEMLQATSHCGTPEGATVLDANVKQAFPDGKYTQEPLNPRSSQRQKSSTRVLEPSVKAASAKRPRLYNHKTKHYRQEFRGPFGSIKIDSSTAEWKIFNNISGHEETRHQHQTFFVFYPSRWLIWLGLNEGIHIRLCNSSTRGWKFAQTASRPVPDDSPIFRLCRQGNTDAVKALLQNGTATIWDTESHGLTPLIFAAGSCRYELCKQLLAAGTDPTSPVGRYVTVWSSWQVGSLRGVCSALAAAAGSVDHDETYWNNSVEDRIATLRLLMSTADIDLSEPYNVGWSLLGIQSDCVTMVWPGKDEDAELTVFKNVLQLLLSHGLLENPQEKTVQKLLANRRSASFEVLEETSRAFFDASPSIIPRAIHLGESGYLKTYYKRGADFHQAVFCNGRWETPTSAAMRTPDDFDEWQGLLLELDVNFQEFVHSELLQKQVWEGSGWTKQSLLNLFEFDFTTRGPGRFCENCLKDLDNKVKVDTAWMQILSRILQGQDPYSSSPEMCPRGIMGRVQHTNAPTGPQIPPPAPGDLVCYRYLLYSTLPRSANEVPKFTQPSGGSTSKRDSLATVCTRIGFYDRICESCWLHHDSATAKPYCHWQYDCRWLCYDCWMSVEKPEICESILDSNSSIGEESADEVDSPFLLSI